MSRTEREQREEREQRHGLVVLILEWPSVRVLGTLQRHGSYSSALLAVQRHGGERGRDSGGGVDRMGRLRMPYIEAEAVHGGLGSRRPGRVQSHAIGGPGR